VTDDPSSPGPYWMPVTHAGLRPCSHCSARQWQQGVTYYVCGACGYRDGPTPEEILHPPPPISSPVVIASEGVEG